MSENKKLRHIWDAGLTDEEYCIIGHIVAQWGALEAEIFGQTLISFGPDINIKQLPKEMNNLNFTSVLELWKERVVDTLEDDKKALFEEAYEKIIELKDVRNSIVHGMWDFSSKEPQTISTMRVKKEQIIHTKFKDGYLSEFGLEVAELNMKIRYPGGLEELFEEQMRNGFFLNEAALRRMKLDPKNSKT